MKHAFILARLVGHEHKFRVRFSVTSAIFCTLMPKQNRLSFSGLSKAQISAGQGFN